MPKPKKEAPEPASVTEQAPPDASPAPVDPMPASYHVFECWPNNLEYLLNRAEQFGLQWLFCFQKPGTGEIMTGFRGLLKFADHTELLRDAAKRSR